MSKSRASVSFGIVSELVVPLLLGTTFIGRFKKLIHLAGKQKVPHYYLPVSILMLHEARSEAEKNSKKVNWITVNKERMPETVGDTH